MVYNNNIPQPTNNLSVSQGDILGNFGTTGIDSSTFGFTREHVSMTDSTFGGLHKTVTFNQNNSPTISGTQSSIHTANGSGAQAGTPVPYFKNANGDYPIFMLNLQSSGTDYGFQIGSLKFAFGLGTCGSGAGAGGSTMIFSFGTVYTAQCCINKSSQFGSGNRAVYASVSGTSLTVTFEPSNVASPTNYYYLVIGI